MATVVLAGLAVVRRAALRPATGRPVDETLDLGRRAINRVLKQRAEGVSARG